MNLNSYEGQEYLANILKSNHKSFLQEELLILRLIRVSLKGDVKLGFDLLDVHIEELERIVNE